MSEVSKICGGFVGLAVGSALIYFTAVSTF